MGKLERIPLNPFEPDREASPELFAGREPELVELRRAMVECARNNAHSMGIVGERGIGKTSLLTEQSADLVALCAQLFRQDIV